jgi:HEPN domain-containing protein
MDEAKRQEIQQWLVRSQRDLGSARRLMEGPKPYLDTAVYHCQQSAEKALKAYLTYRDTTFGKSHNLVALLSLCVRFEGGFEEWYDAAAMLTPYATEFRYPGELLEPTRAEADHAFDTASRLFDYVTGLLPAEVKCQG